MEVYISWEYEFWPFIFAFLCTKIQFKIILKIIMQLLFFWPTCWFLKSCFTISPHMQFLVGTYWVYSLNIKCCFYSICFGMTKIWNLNIKCSIDPFISIFKLYCTSWIIYCRSILKSGKLCFCAIVWQFNQDTNLETNQHCLLYSASKSMVIDTRPW